MGVTGLWKLIEQSGKEVLIDSLENKILAIDISIWLHQVIKGFQDRRGNALQNAHLLGLFNRLCKLLYYRIKPVFIFDGSVPALKRDTIAKRNQGRTKILKEVERIQELLLEAMNKEKIVQQALAPTALNSLTSNENSVKPKKDENDEVIFTIPQYLSPAKTIDDSCQPGSSSDFNTSLSENDSFDDNNLQHYYNINLQSIDVNSSHFKSLPADVRLEILGDIKQMRKQHSWGRLHEMPTNSNNFSEFQMKRLLKRRQVQVSLEEAEKELEGRCLTLSELETFLSEQGIVTAEKNANSRIHSDANTRFLLVKDLKKAIEKAAKLECSKNESAEEELTEKEKSDSKESKVEECPEENVICDEASFETIDEESDYENYKNDKDLQLAIQLSLNQTNVYNDNDYVASKAFLSKEQKVMFKNATGSARDYLLKYGLIKNLDLDQIDDSQIETTEESQLLNDLKHNKSLMAEIIGGKSDPTSVDLNRNKIKINDDKDKSQASVENYGSIAIISDDSDSDVDFIEVSESSNDSIAKNISLQKTEKFQIHLDPTKSINPEEDIFADIFSQEPEKSLSELNETSLPTRKDVDKKLSSSLNEINKKESQRKNVFNILESLQKEVFEVVKLSLEDINTEKSVLEVPDSQESCAIDKTENKNFKNDLSIIKRKDSTESIDNFLEVKGDKNNDYCIEIPDSQDNISIKNNNNTNEEHSIEILDSQNDISGNREIHESEKRSLSILDLQNDVKQSESMKALETTTEDIEILDDSLTPLEKTPSKQKIENFFKTEYMIKKTPNKDINDEEEEVPKVTSPFFVKKTPGSSGRKKLLTDGGSEKRVSKVSKTLFENIDEGGEKEIDSEMKAIEKASESLRNNKSKEELETMVTELGQEKNDLEKERNRQDRMGLTITEKMTRDCMDLLKLFGIPYIVSPMEAEAQCAFLETINLTHGTITDDSDIWLFGGRTVYKNFFDKQKHVLEFKIDQIQRDFSLDREKLIQLAILVGSDYTIGIKGIGAVTALEILAAFPNTPVVENETTKVMSILSSLRKFRDWFNNSKSVGFDTVKVKLKSKLKNIEISNGFPNLAIAEAYLHPSVDDSNEQFTWGSPNIEEIRKFARKYFGWTQIKTDETLGPVLKRLEQRQSQTTIKNFFAVKSAFHKRDIKLSKRVEQAVKKISKNYDSMEDDSVKAKVQSHRKPKRNSKKKETEVTNTTANKTSSNQGVNRKRKTKIDTNALSRPDGPSTSVKLFGESPEKRSKLNKTETEKSPCIPQTRQVIPQREQDISEMNKRKELASALFKRSRAAVTKSTKNNPKS